MRDRPIFKARKDKVIQSSVHSASTQEVAFKLNKQFVDYVNWVSFKSPFSL